MISTKNQRLLKNIEQFIVDEEYALAKKYLLKFLKVDPKNPEAYYLLGDSLCKLAEFDQAVQASEIANNLLPDNPQIIHLLGWAHFMNGDITTGRKFLELALKMVPKETQILCDLAVLETRAGNEKALEYSQQAVTLAPNDPIAQEVFVVANRFFKLRSKFNLTTN